jgi:TPR repeat protein
MNTLGYMLEHGIGTDKDIDRATDWYREGDGAGYALSTFNLGVLAEHGIGQPKDPARAMQLYGKASDAGYAPARCRLGIMHFDGLGTTKDPGRGWALISSAADLGEEVCQLRAGLAYRYGVASVGRDLAKAAHYLDLAAAQGSDDASAQAAEISMRENPTDEKLVREARATLQRLADSGNSRAQFLFAEACVLGRPPPRDMPCARRYFALAAQGGFDAAASNLGLLLSSGLGGPVDFVAAEAAFRRAIELGATQSRYELGRLLLHTDKNVPEGIELLLASASDGNFGAAYVVDRYCREHPTCPVGDIRRKALRKQLRGLNPESRHALAWGLAVDSVSDAIDGRYAMDLVNGLPADLRAKPEVIDTLAAANARAGDFKEAASLERKSIAALKKSSMKWIMEERLSLYESGKTWDLPY